MQRISTTIAVICNRQWYLVVVLLLSAVGITAQPVVVTQPRDTAVCVETTVGFSVIAVNTTSYQWQEFDGAGWYNLNSGFSYVQGAQTPDLTIIDANLALNGYQYRCVVRDAASHRDTSQPAELGVHEPPVILSHPVNDRVCKGEEALFMVSANNVTHFQWQENNAAGWVDLDENAFYNGVKTPELSVYAVLGMNGYRFRCIMMNFGCPDTSLSALLTVDPLPVSFDLIGDVGFCSGGSLTLGLTGSEQGVTYNLLLNGNETGVVAEGTGMPLDFGDVFVGGLYTVRAYNNFTPCTSLMGDGLDVVEYPLPALFTLQGGGAICEGEAGPEIFLSGSAAGIAYTLFRNGVNTGDSLMGTGFPLSFGQHQESGSYTVLGTNPVSTCQQLMEGAVSVTVNPLPVANAGEDVFLQQGNSTLLSGEAWPAASSYHYSWQPEDKCLTPQNRQTNTVSLYHTTLFNLQVTNLSTGCVSAQDTLIVFMQGGPLAVDISASATQVCQDETVVLTALPSGGTGNYSYQWSSVPAGLSFSSASVTLMPQHSMVCMVVVSDGQSQAVDSVFVSVNALPEAMDLGGGGTFCPGDTGPEVILSGSEQGVEYTLFRHPAVNLLTITGNGLALNFGNFNVSGDYYVTATAGGSCTTLMNGEVHIVAGSEPTANAGSDIFITQGQQTLLHGEGTGGSGYYRYQWQPEDQLVNPQNNEPLTIELFQSTIFSLEVTDLMTGCQGPDDNMVVFVTGGNLSVEAIAQPDIVCQGEQVRLKAIPTGGTGNYMYAWHSSPAGLVSSNAEVWVQPLTDTWYYVQVTDNGQQVSDSVWVQVSMAPQTYGTTGGGAFCEGNISEPIILTNSEQDVTYGLFEESLGEIMSLAGSGTALNFGVPPAQGDYWIVATSNLNQCAGYMPDTLTYLVHELPVADAGPDMVSAVGEAVQLQGSGTGTGGTLQYSWMPDYLLVNPQVQDPWTLALDQSNNFFLTVSDPSTGCESPVDQMTVYVSGGELTATVDAIPRTICLGDEVNLTCLPSGGTGDYTYSWTSSPVRFYASSPEVTDMPGEDTWYFVVVDDGLSVYYDSVYVSVDAPPAVFMVEGGGHRCQNDAGLVITLNGSEPGVIYHLYRESQLVRERIGTGLPLSFGEFTVEGVYQAQASYSAAGCYADMIGSAVITNYPLPVANAGPDRLIQTGTSATLNGSAGSGSGEYFFHWTPETDLINPEEAVAYTRPLSQTKLFKLRVEDASSSCTSQEDQAIVFVAGGPLAVQIESPLSIPCSGTPLMLTALPSGGTGNYSCYWYSLPMGYMAYGNEVVVTPTGPTWYTVVVEDGLNTASDSVLLEPKALPLKFMLNGDEAFCPDEGGASLRLEGSEQDVLYQLLYQAEPTGLYQTGTGAALDLGEHFSGGYYSVIATTAEGCEGMMSNSLQVIAGEKPIVYQVSGGGTYCSNDPMAVLLLQSSQYGWKYSLWKEDVATGIEVEGTGGPIGFHDLPGTGLYTVVAEHNYHHCIGVMDGWAEFTFKESPQLEIIGDSMACIGDTLVVTAAGADLYQWNTDPVQLGPVVRIPVENDVEIEVTGSNSLGCQSSAVWQVYAARPPLLETDINDNLQTVTVLPGDLSLYTFSFNGSVVQEGQRNIWNYSDFYMQSDTLHIWAVSQEGCSGKESLFLTLEDTPNAFTPNGDGVNDVFLPGVEITVYSSWGGQLYHGDTGWDGKYQGKLVAPNTYYYIRPYYSSDGSISSVYKGSVTVVIENQ